MTGVPPTADPPLRPTAPSRKGLTRLVRAVGHSLRGLRDAFRSEEAFRQEAAILVVVVIPGVVWLGGSPLERLLLFGSWFQVLIVELLNSALETTVDRIGTEHHDLSRAAKDMGSAAVLLSLGLAAVTWATVAFATL